MGDTDQRATGAPASRWGGSTVRGSPATPCASGSVTQAWTAPGIRGTRASYACPCHFGWFVAAGSPEVCLRHDLWHTGTRRGPATAANTRGVPGRTPGAAPFCPPLRARTRSDSRAAFFHLRPRNPWECPSSFWECLYGCSAPPRRHAALRSARSSGSSRSAWPARAPKSAGAGGARTADGRGRARRAALRRVRKRMRDLRLPSETPRWRGCPPAATPAANPAQPDRKRARFAGTVFQICNLRGARTFPDPKALLLCSTPFSTLVGLKTFLRCLGCFCWFGFLRSMCNTEWSADLLEVVYSCCYFNSPEQRSQLQLSRISSQKDTSVTSIIYVSINQEKSGLFTNDATFVRRQSPLWNRSAVYIFQRSGTPLPRPAPSTHVSSPTNIGTQMWRQKVWMICKTFRIEKRF